MTALSLWLRLVVGSVVAVAVLVALDPPLPSATLTGPGGILIGAVVGVALYLAVARHRPVLPLRSAPLRLALAKTCFLALAAANEEILWRRVVLGELLAVSPAAALAGSTLGFGLAHRTRPGLHLLTGAAFGGVYLATGALLACFAAHWTYNLLLLWLVDRTRVVSVPP